MSDQLDDAMIIELFHKLYYEKRQRKTWRNTYWVGVQTKKTPFDLWIYQEIVYKTRPDIIIETGVYKGGSTLYLAQICDLIGTGHVVGIDIELGLVDKAAYAHPRITLIQGGSTDQDVFKRVESLCQGKRTMTILDSDHKAAHVAAELKMYSKLVTPGCYLIVEDSNINGHPVAPSYGPGPYEAVADFLQGTQEFVVDEECEKYMLTFSPRGFLRRELTQAEPVLTEAAPELNG